MVERSSQRTERGPFDAAKDRYLFDVDDIVRDHDELLWKVASRLYDHDVTDHREDSYPDGRDRRKYELALLGTMGGTTRIHSEDDVLSHYERVPEDEHPESFEEVKHQPEVHQRRKTWSVSEHLGVHDPEDLLAVAGLIDDRIGLPASVRVEAAPHPDQYVGDDDA